MSGENKRILAEKVFNTLCSAIDKNEWQYDKKDDILTVYFGVKSKDLPIRFVIAVDEERELIRLFSPFNFNMSEGKRIDGAVAVCAASFGMYDGHFGYDISDGSITFKMTASYRNSIIGEELFLYLIFCSCSMVEKFNDQFMAIDKGIISVEEFIAKIN